MSFLEDSLQKHIFLIFLKQNCFGIIQNNQSNSEFSALFSELSEILLVESWVVLFFISIFILKRYEDYYNW